MPFNPNGNLKFYAVPERDRVIYVRDRAAGTPVLPHTIAPPERAYFVPISGALFPHEPTMYDINQMQMGNCYLLAAINSIVARAGGPEFINNMIGIGAAPNTIRVRLFHRDSPEGDFYPVYIELDRTILELSIFHSKSGLASRFWKHAAPWVYVLEKAYAAYQCVFGGDCFAETTLESYNDGGRIYYEKKIISTRAPQTFIEAIGHGGKTAPAFEILLGMPAQGFLLYKNLDFSACPADPSSYFVDASAKIISDANSLIALVVLDSGISDFTSLGGAEQTAYYKIFAAAACDETLLNESFARLGVPPFLRQNFIQRAQCSSKGIVFKASDAQLITARKIAIKIAIDDFRSCLNKSYSQDAEPSALTRARELFFLHKDTRADQALDLVRRYVPDLQPAVRDVLQKYIIKNMLGKRGSGKYPPYQIDLYEKIHKAVQNSLVCLGSDYDVGPLSEETKVARPRANRNKGLGGQHVYTVLNCYRRGDVLIVLVRNPHGIYVRENVETMHRYYDLDGQLHETPALSAQWCMNNPRPIREHCATENMALPLPEAELRALLKGGVFELDISDITKRFRRIHIGQMRP